MVVDPTPKELAYQICEEMQVSAAISNNRLRSCLLSQLPNVGLTQTKIIKVIDKKMGERQREESKKGLVSAEWKSLGGY